MKKLTNHTKLVENSRSTEANSSVCQELSRVLFNLKDNYRVYKNPPQAPILGQMDSLKSPKPYSIRVL